MEKYSKLWRAFFTISLAAIAIQQLVTGGFRSVMIPPLPVWLSACTVCVWADSILLIAAAAVIQFSNIGRTAAVYLGTVFLLILLVLHIPYELRVNLHDFGSWGDALEILVYSGGAFIVAASIPTTGEQGRVTNLLEKLLPAGRIFFSITMIAYGSMHFLYSNYVITLVPAWIPGHLFWTYVAGAALIAGGVGIILNIKLRLAANLLGIILFIWLIVLHIPRAIADPHSGAGNEWTSAFEALGFSGIAFLIGVNAKQGKL